MAFAGLHPVVAVYSTFLNRAFDQLLLDVALHKAGVTFVLDRAGITETMVPRITASGSCVDWNCPNLESCSAKRWFKMKELLREATSIKDSPSLIRFPKGVINPDLPAFERRDGIDFLYRGESPDILLIAVGAMAQLAVDAAAQAYREGVGVTVIDPRWFGRYRLRRLLECLIVIRESLLSKME